MVRVFTIRKYDGKGELGSPTIIKDKRDTPLARMSTQNWLGNVVSELFWNDSPDITEVHITKEEE